MSPPPVPVLAFHAIQPGPGPLRIDPHTFRRVVDALASSGATGVTAATAGRILAGEVESPARPVAFTFDDGYASVHDEAWPILRAVGWPATVFPVTSALGRRNDWDGPGNHDLRILDRAQLLALHDGGWEIGGHTHTHRSLPALTQGDVVAEVEQADAALAELLGAAPVSFAYPYGHHDRTSRSVAGDRYRWSWTIGAERATSAHEPSRLPRVEAWYVRNPRVGRHLHDAAGTAWLTARRAVRAARAVVA